MLKMLVLAFSLTALSAGALTLPLATSEFQTDTAAIAEGAADAQGDSSATTPLPLITSSTVVGTTDFASGNGIAAEGLLSTSAEADSAAGIASAVGTSRFLGTFHHRGVLRLSLDFTSLGGADAGAFSLGSLILQVTSGGATVLDEIFNSTGLFNRRLVLMDSPNQVIDILLSSEASTINAGSAFNSAMLTFDVSLVPEPATWLLIAGTLLLVVAQRARKQR